MKSSLALLLSLATAVVVLGASFSAGSTLIGASLRELDEGSDPVLRDPLERSLERAQAGLEATVQVYVDHSTPENPWRVESLHYEVTSTSSYRETEALALGLDQMVPLYQSILGTSWVPEERLRAFIFADLDAYNTAGDDWGDERSSFYSSFLGVDHPERPLVTLRGANETQLLMWGTHAAVQQFIERAFARRVETWLEQGLSAYFSLYWDWNYGKEQLQSMMENGDFIPLAELLGADIGDYAEGAHTRVIELGMLCSYLLHHREESRINNQEDAPDTSFQNFLQDSLRGRPTRRHPFRTWFTQNIDGVERDFRAFYSE